MKKLGNALEFIGILMIFMIATIDDFTISPWKFLVFILMWLGLSCGLIFIGRNIKKYKFYIKRVEY